MKITLFSTTNKAQVLGDNADRKFIKGYTSSLSLQAETVPIADAAFAAHFAHENRTVPRSFTVDYIFKSAADAFVFSEKWPEQVFASGTMEVSDQGGTVRRPFVLQSVKLASDPGGKTVIFNYAFECGGVI